MEVEGEYCAELNNAVFGGDLSGAKGTFRGQFSTSALDIVGNPTIAGRSTAITTVVDLPGYTKPGQNYWHTVASGIVDVPLEDKDGGYLLVAIEYWHEYNGGNTHFDEAFRLFSERVVIGGQVAYSQSSAFGSLWHKHPRRYNEYALHINSPGQVIVAIQQYYPDEGHNVYPHIRDRQLRLDYIRR